ncbi:hypothetical protein ABGT03_06435 [Acinetobacter baumannii]|uniref:hypothetical protein n=1 Tax=Acinetobacter calcoaceticus/baumannii complex TaxID=909768 RepID=UPI00071873D0|nr:MULTISPECIES: hypothetical protein [Acinetobacter calcoaceticus/baumannii complex]KRW42373.1 hypothetical protein AO727_00950 [Acinetobacter baumannii]MBP1497304.1 hypothetical protein [Acinetobacter nosocomialis]MBR7681069.1 hypothetical protein [Acinetobacter nosocomialis]MCZ2939281.1 hypothetical protein [Acinetobacter baumannii]MDA5694415.1 hypothetical protein [Acinetobacter baumannii]
MLTPPRFVVLDDKKEHLEPIIETFKLIGSSCIGVQYNEEDASHLQQDYYKGVRGLFIDLNLSGSSSLGSSTHYAEITRILETVISCDNGPFIMILWTDNPQECDQLIEYIETRLDPNKKYCKPLLIKSLSKTMYIDANSAIKESNRETFKEEIKGFFSSVPQIAALFDWESKVLEAVNQTLIELLNLVPSDKRNFTDYPTEIDKVLSCISRETVGKSHVATDPQKALNLAIYPILVDKILNRTSNQENIQLWNNAITQVKTASISDEKAVGKFNKMLHLAVTGHESMSPYDWGAVVEIPSEIFNNEFCLGNFGYNQNHLIKNTFCFNNIEKLKPILIRLGASCDYAQNKQGPIPYIFGFVVDAEKYHERERDFSDPEKKFINKKLSDWVSPLFNYIDEQPAFYIVLNLQLVISKVKGQLDTYQTLYRLREQLLNQVIVRATSFASRPGINELYVK